MLKTELLEIIANGENSGVEFKRDDIRPEQLAKEVVAMANFQGGRILLGVEDDGVISGIQRDDLEEWVMNVFQNKIHPMILPFYEEVKLDDDKTVAVVSFPIGISKPYVVRHSGKEEIYIRVKAPRNTEDYIYYFCGKSGLNQDELTEKEALRLTLYQNVAKLLRAFANIANEMPDAGYSAQDVDSIRTEVAHFEKVRDEVKLASGDLVEMKRFEPAMRHLLDMYIRADDSEVLMDFEELGLIELIVEKGADAVEALPESIRKNQEAMAETIENNVRKTIVDENPVNPKYYEQMSVLLDELIELRRQKAIEYQEYLEKIRELSRKVIRPEQTAANYPPSMDSNPKRAFYDNFGQDEVLATKIDSAIRYTKKADWVGDRFKEREIANAVREETTGYEVDIQGVMELAKAQKEYH